MVHEVGEKARALRLGTDVRWGLVWLLGVSVLAGWNAAFLNEPARKLLQTAFVHSLIAGALSVCAALAMGWMLGVLLHALESRQRYAARYLVTFVLNVLRSIPQILGVLAGYMILTTLIRGEVLEHDSGQLAWMAASISLMLCPEVTDLVLERIRYFSRHDFVPALRCCGVSEVRIVNIEILWRNSREHLIHAAIALFGSALILQCSVDFIVSVGLARDVSLANFPVSLGGLLARLDSKQDILAIGKAMLDIGYLPTLFVRHLQGISTAVVIVFSLVCVHKVANAFVRRKGL